MAPLAGGKATRRLHVVRVHQVVAPVVPRRVGVVGSCRHATWRAACYFGNGLRLLGQTFAASAWSPEPGDVHPDELQRQP
jgi:hypothetical protein